MSKSNSSDVLSVKEKFGYGLGDAASNFYFQTFNIFLLYYYTDVFGLSAAAIGTMFLVTRLWDAVNDPIMGLIADRTNTRYGKFRPYLIWMAIPYGVLGYAMFANPDLSPMWKLVYAYVTYTMMMTVYTAINIPYSALMGVMSPSSKERTSLSSYRFVCAFTGGLLISMLVRPLVRTLGSGSEAAGFQMTMGIFAFVSILLFFYTFKSTKERVSPPPQQIANLKGELKDLFKNLPWITLFFAAIFNMASVAMRGGVTVYFFKYYMDDDNSTFWLFFDRTTLFMTVGTLALIAGVMCTKFVSTRYDKRSLMVVLSTLNAIVMILFFFIPPEYYWTMMIVNVIGTFVVGPTPALVWAMYADTADYGEWKFGRRSTALVFSAALFAQKFGLMVGGTVTGWTMDFNGFVPNQVQSGSSLLCIRLLYTIVPAALSLLNVAAIYFYPLRDVEVARVEQELAARKLTQ